MISFYIHVAGEGDSFVWRAHFANMRPMHREEAPAKLRNTVNHVMTWARHIRPGHCVIALTKAAEARRVALGLPRFVKPEYRGGPA